MRDGQALKGVEQHAILCSVTCGDHVDRDAFVFGDPADVVGPDHTRVVGTIGECHDGFASGYPGRIPHGQQQRVEQRRVVTCRNVAQPRSCHVVILCKRRGAKQIAAEGI